MNRMDINIRDPFVLVEDGVYYLFGTTMNGETLSFLCYKSNDLEDFEGPFFAFTPPEGFWANRDFWAPEVHKYNGKYYMFASFKSDKRCRGTQILVSDYPVGPYAPLTDAPYTPKDWECLDGTFYVENGIPYSIFAHEWVQIKDGTFCIVTLSNDLKNALTEPRKLLTASEAPWTNSIKNSQKEDCYVTDGPFIYTLSDGSLIMIWSSFSEGGYSVGQAKSINGILGPWVHIDKPLFYNDGGHGMIFKDFNDNLFLAIHQPNKSPYERPYFFEIEEHNGILVLK